MLHLQRTAGNRAVSRLMQDEGQPLDRPIRVEMESRFGHDFGRVRIHTGSQATAMATALDARAYTVGDDIVFNAGRYAPYGLDGRRLLAHELAHVVQQRRGGAAPPLDPVAPHERSARDIANKVIDGSGPIRVASGTQVGVARDEEPPSSAPPRVLVLGLYERPFPGGQTFPVQDSLLKEAKATTGLRPMLMGGMESFGEVFRGLAPSGLASATLVQEALEGGGKQNIRAIYINEASVTLLAKHSPRATAAHQAAHPEGTFQTAAEYRSVVASLAANTHKVDIYIKHAKGLSIVRANKQVVEGRPLPAQLRPHLPPTFVTEPPPGGTAPPSGQPPKGAPPSPPPPAAPKPPAARPAQAQGRTPSRAKPPERGKLTAAVPPPQQGKQPMPREAIGQGAVLALNTILAILEHFAEKKQRERAEAEWNRQWPEIQKAITATGRGVIVYFEYTKDQHGNVLIFEGLRWHTGGPHERPPGAIRGPGQTPTFTSTYVAPTSEQAAKTDETALEARRHELWRKQKIVQRVGESMAKEGAVGRTLRERAQDRIDVTPAYAARSHLVSAGIAIKQKRYGAASASLDLAEDRINQMRDNIDAYRGRLRVERGLARAAARAAER